MRKLRRLSAMFMALLMLVGICVPEGLISTAYAADACMTFSFNGSSYTINKGQADSGTGVSWSCDADGNFSITFTADGSFAVTEGTVEGANVTVIGGGAGGSSGYSRAGGNGGGGGETVSQAVSIPENKSFDVVIGTGGAGGNPTSYGGTYSKKGLMSADGWNKGIGTDGGQSKFGKIIANGGIADAGGAGGSWVAPGEDGTGKDGGGGGSFADWYETDWCNYAVGRYECLLCGSRELVDQSTWMSTLELNPTGGQALYTLGGKGGPEGGGDGGNPQNDCPSGGHGPMNGGNGKAPGGGGGGGAICTAIYALWTAPCSATGSEEINCFAGSGGSGSDGIVILTGNAESKTGYLTLQKSADDSQGVCTGNTNYSLAGAVYGVYKTKSDAEGNTNAIATLTTDASGNSNTVKLAEDTYYIKEITAPSGFALDTTVYPVQVTDKKTVTFKASDTPILDPIGVLIYKTDTATGTGTSAGAASLEGAEFTFSFYPGYYTDAASAEASGPPQRSWIWKTNANGRIPTLDKSLLISGDPVWTDVEGNFALPLGTLIIQETKAPEHYTIDLTKYVVHITEDGADAKFVQTYNAPTLPNTLAHGGVSVDKLDSALADPTKPQGEATLEGAVFSIINNNDVNVTVSGQSYAPGAEVATISTDAAGHAESSPSLLPLGKYTLKEKTPPTGYTLNTAWSYDFEITDAKNNKLVSAGTVADEVITGTLTVRKTDNETGLKTPQGDGSFKGAVFNVRNASANTIVFNGKEYKPGDVITTITTNAKGIASVSGLPYGNYYLEEVSIPKATAYTVNTTWNSTTFVSGDGTYTSADCPEELAVHGGITVHKVDAAMNSDTAEGSASLEGAVFEIRNASAQAIVYKGKTYNVGDAITTITTDKTGTATIKDGLPVGTYEVREKTPSEGYLLNTDWVGTVVIRSDGEIAELTGANACPETPIKGGVSVQKLDKESGTSIGYGGMTLENAQFAILNRSENPVVYNGKTVNPFKGTYDYAKTYTDGIVCFITTDVNGFASTGTNDLPYGKYEIVEAVPASGYTINETWKKTFTIKNDGQMIAFDGADACTEEMSRLNIHFRKINQNTGETMANVVFKVTHLESGETHYIVTDPNGVYDSSYIPHTQKTNGNDAAVVNGKVDESKLDYTCGTWFGGNPVDTKPDGTVVGAFPYGHYKFEEISTSANKGMYLVEFEKLAYARGFVMDFGDIEDGILEELETTLTDSVTNDHYISSGSTVTLYDSVTVHNCRVGKQYTLEATLMDKTNKAPLLDTKGKPITASYTFTAIGSTMLLDKKIVFTFPSSLLTGGDLVCFEKLTNGSGFTYALHEDFDDEAQTVRVVTIGTTAQSEDGDKYVFAGKDAVIVDKVSYTGFAPNEEVKLVATLYDKSTGKPVTDENGRDITAEAKFTPTELKGTAEVKIIFDGSLFKGKELVVFERAYSVRTGSLIAAHEDINDEAQTVKLLQISTFASNEKDSENKAIPAAADAKIFDRVDYEGLEPGTKYTMVGEIYDVSTLKPISNASAKTVFTADSTGKGSVWVEITLDTTGLAGKNLVVVESLYTEKGKLLAREDTLFPNEPETVYIPEIKTTAVTGNDTKTSLPDTKVTIYDTVRYTNLFPGQEYKIEGRLMDKKTGSELLDGNGKPITASIVFTPKKADGEVTLSFGPINASLLGGESVVAFETVSYKDISGQYRFLTEHEDIDDEEQTVHFPKLFTSAVSADGIHTINPKGKIKVIDTVSVTNAAVGRTYVFKGSIVDENGKTLKGVAQEVRMTATEENFKVDLEFELDAEAFALEGKHFTVFEKMLEVISDGSGTEKLVEVGSHEELQDENQTVWFPKIRTKATGADGEKFIEIKDETETVTVKDTVSYEGLKPGESYVITGTLMDKSTGTPILDDAGMPVMAAVVFMPADTKGTAELEFRFPAKLVLGKTVVAFERCTSNGVLVAVHEDINDEDQTVEFSSTARIFKYDATTGTPIPGVVITVTDETDKTECDVTTGADGYAVFPVIPRHTYSYKEKTEAAGYVLNTDVQSFTVDEFGKVSEELSVPNWLTGTVVISKTNCLDGKPVEGAEIAVYSKDGNNYTELFRQTTDRFGRIYFYPGGMVGTYYFRELKAPSGYYIDEDYHSFTIHKDLTVTGETRFVNAPSGTIVLKKSSESGDYLAGATFGVYDANGKLIYTNTTDDKGRIYFVSPTPGSYYFVELEAPKGYLKSSDKLYFSVDSYGNVTGTTTMTDKSDPSPGTGDELGSTAFLIATIASTAMCIASAAYVFIVYMKIKKSM